MKTFKTKMQQELEKMQKANKLSYVDECRLKNEPVNYSLLNW